jgi:hypothetical protein
VIFYGRRVYGTRSGMLTGWDGPLRRETPNERMARLLRENQERTRRQMVEWIKAPLFGPAGKVGW